MLGSQNTVMGDMQQSSFMSVLTLLVYFSTAKLWRNILCIDTVVIKIEIPFFHASFLANDYLIHAFSSPTYFCIGCH